MSGSSIPASRAAASQRSSGGSHVGVARIARTSPGENRCSPNSGPMHEQREQVERFWREVDRLRAATQLMGALIQREWPESDVTEIVLRTPAKPSEF
jgi:hypothetical protein